MCASLCVAVGGGDLILLYLPFIALQQIDSFQSASKPRRLGVLHKCAKQAAAIKMLRIVHMFDRLSKCSACFDLLAEPDYDLLKKSAVAAANILDGVGASAQLLLYIEYFFIALRRGKIQLSVKDNVSYDEFSGSISFIGISSV